MFDNRMIKDVYRNFLYLEGSAEKLIAKVDSNRRSSYYNVTWLSLYQSLLKQYRINK